MEQMALAIRCFYESRLKEKADEFEKYGRENTVDVLTEQIVQMKKQIENLKSDSELGNIFTAGFNLPPILL
ncbi:hypothetical protein ATZ36_00575 [Candidatus Endomicrobiellum trichonymphae]|uniref:Uncharacterized protein n=1 Tax=Endomicrobium trichonymphae TaxID=1408204 RepID=A0A1E5IKF7_ENDTX|nr:hypothetical protein ATZ36_00575 [Candidatus Endomicrobium trichonymphae]